MNKVDFQAGDLVEIIKNPSISQMNATINMVGMSGYISEINDDYVQFVELIENGMGGSGGVHIDNLKLSHNPRLKELKNINDDRIRKWQQEAISYSDRYHLSRDKCITNICKETGVSPELIEEIIGLYEQWERDRR